MRDLLAIFPDVTKYMSQAGQPTLPWVLPMYDLMETDLKAKCCDEKIPEKIRSAAEAGLEKLQYYHDLAKKNQFNWLATILHPALRHWFNTRGLAPRAEQILTHAYESYKEQYMPTAPPPPAASGTSSGGILDRILGTTVVPDVDEPALSEIQRYLRGFAKSSATHDNALTWWRIHEKDLPVMAMMARDFLAIPASSVSVERLFSGSGYLVTRQRSSMSAETIRECMCTKSWIRDGLMKYLQ